MAKQLEVMRARVAQLYLVSADVDQQKHLMAQAFKELGVASEEMQVVIDELHQQNEELWKVQVALEAERQRYQELLESTLYACLVIDEQGIIQEANRAAAKILNTGGLHNLLYQPLVSFVTQEQHQPFRQKQTRLQAEQQMQETWQVRICPQYPEKPFEATLHVAKISSLERKPGSLLVAIHTKPQEGVVKDFDYTSNYPVHTYDRGEIIPLGHDMIWLVRQGLVKLNTMNDKGEEVLVGLLGPSTPFGSHLTLLPTYEAKALSKNVHLISIPLTDIVACPQLMSTFCQQITQHLRQTEFLLAISRQRRVKDRLKSLLLFLKQEIGEPTAEGTRLAVRLTHQDLADACSTTRVTITRLLSQWQKRGEIYLDWENYIILPH